MIACQTGLAKSSGGAKISNTDECRGGQPAKGQKAVAECFVRNSNDGCCVDDVAHK